MLALSAVFLFCGCQQKQAPAESSSAAVTEDTTVPSTEEVRKRKENLETILVLGLDKNEYPDDSRAYINDMQSDFNLVLVLDKDTNVCTPLLLNRDTMTEIIRLGVFGDEAGTYTGQLALAHTYGSGGSDSCINAKKVVSKFLGGVTIDHYMSFTMEAVPTVNDAVGAVTVTELDEFQDSDTQVKGETVKLMGQESLNYVRGRHGAGDQTNISRMKRQEQYMSALIERLIAAAKEDPDLLTKLTLSLGDAFQSDYTVSQLQKLADRLMEAKIEDFVTIEGEAKVGTEFMEFYPDQAALEKTIDEVFYQ